MRISDWSSDVCSSDLPASITVRLEYVLAPLRVSVPAPRLLMKLPPLLIAPSAITPRRTRSKPLVSMALKSGLPIQMSRADVNEAPACNMPPASSRPPEIRSEEHTSELQSLMRISYAVFCLKKKTHRQ